MRISGIAPASLVGLVAVFALDCALTTSLDGLSGGGVEGASSGTPVDGGPVDAAAEGSDGAVRSASTVFVFGGKDGSSVTSVFRSAIQADGSLGPWSPEVSLPQPRSYAPAVTAGSAVYILGGEGAGFFADGVVANVVGASLGGWSTVPNFPVPRIRHGVVHAGGHVYLLGGYDDSGVTLSEVRFAAVSSDSIGSWNPTTALPSGRARFAFASTDSAIYVFAGSLSNGAETAETLFAPVQAGGGVGAWQSGPSLPSARIHARAAIYGNHVLVTGGDAVADVFVADLDATGAVVRIRPTTSMPSPRYTHASFVSGRYLYVIGGTEQAGATARVDYAELADDGSVLAWRPTTPLPGPRSYVAAIAQ